jgi:hypothetical protein
VSQDVAGAAQEVSGTGRYTGVFDERSAMAAVSPISAGQKARLQARFLGHLNLEEVGKLLVARVDSYRVPKICQFATF